MVFNIVMELCCDCYNQFYGIFMTTEVTWEPTASPGSSSSTPVVVSYFLQAGHEHYHHKAKPLWRPTEDHGLQPQRWSKQNSGRTVSLAQGNGEEAHMLMQCGGASRLPSELSSSPHP